MKKIFIIFILLLLPNLVYAKANYTYSMPEKLDNTSISENKNNKNAVELKAGCGFNNNKGYIKIKANNKNIVRISTPKISNNSILKLISVTF